MFPRTLSLIIILGAFLGASACAPAGQAGTAPVPPVSPTPGPPTPTPVPMAALVNGEGIPLVEFQAELERFQAAQAALGNQIPPDEAGQRVLDELIDQVLLAQAARAAGFQAGDDLLQERLQALAASLDGPQALADWQAEHGYTPESFQTALRRAIEAAWMRDQVLASVPPTAEQVHVQQILLYNEDRANAVLAQLQAGADFAAQAALYDPVTRGELGWFPRGHLFDPAIEQAAFSLQPGQTSQVIASQVGFHILRVLARETDRPLSPDARLALQQRALAEWLEEQRRQSTITLAP
jgi:peptidyl-prolyl cis-trans isomerase C